MSTSSLTPRARWGTLAAVLAVGVGLDQLAKQLAHSFLRGRGLVSVIEGFFELRYARNPGAFFSLGAEIEPSLRRLLFVAASGLAIVLIGRMYARAPGHARALRWALMALLAGAVGNLIDRLLYGEVIDFVHLYWRGVFDWATFNLADVFIVVGVALLGVDMMRREPETEVGSRPCDATTGARVNRASDAPPSDPDPRKALE